MGRWPLRVSNGGRWWWPRTQLPLAENHGLPVQLVAGGWDCFQLLQNGSHGLSAPQSQQIKLMKLYETYLYKLSPVGSGEPVAWAANGDDFGAIRLEGWDKVIYPSMEEATSDPDRDKVMIVMGYFAIGWHGSILWHWRMTLHFQTWLYMHAACIYCTVIVCVYIYIYPLISSNFEFEMLETLAFTIILSAELGGPPECHFSSLC